MQISHLPLVLLFILPCWGAGGAAPDDTVVLTIQWQPNAGGGSLPIRIRKDATVLELKQLIEQEEGVPTMQQNLYWAGIGKLGYDDHLLSDYGDLGAANQVLYLKTWTRSPIGRKRDLRVKLFGRFYFEIKGVAPVPSRLLKSRADTIQTIKGKIEEAYHIPAAQQVLTFDGYALADDATVPLEGDLELTLQGGWDSLPLPPADVASPKLFPNAPNKDNILGDGGGAVVPSTGHRPFNYNEALKGLVVGFCLGAVAVVLYRHVFKKSRAPRRGSQKPI